jgi:vancomycin permeability regulator SanA
MPIARTWTPDQDATIKRMCAAGATWAEIGLEMGLSRNTIIERGRRIGAVPNLTQRVVEREPKFVGHRHPLPPGSAATWGLIAPGYEYPIRR